MNPDANLAEQELLLQELSEYEESDDTGHPAYRAALKDLKAYRAAMRAWLDRGKPEPNWDAATVRVARYYGKVS